MVLLYIFGLIPFLYTSFFMLIGLFTPAKNFYVPALGDPKKITIIIFARNEARCISQSVKALIDQGSHCVVICDNCSDNTASLARFSGATVWEMEYHSKPKCERYVFLHIHDFVFTQYVGFLDADTIPESDYCARLVTSLERFPVVSGSVKSQKGNKWTQFNSYLFAYTSRFLLLPRLVLNMGCFITGVCWGARIEIIETIPNPSLSVVEDLEYVLVLNQHKIKVRYVPNLIAFTQNPLSFKQSIIQRERWIRGSFQLVKFYFLRGLTFDFNFYLFFIFCNVFLAILSFYLLITLPFKIFSNSLIFGLIYAFSLFLYQKEEFSWSSFFLMPLYKFVMLPFYVIDLFRVNSYGWIAIKRK